MKRRNFISMATAGALVLGTGNLIARNLMSSSTNTKGGAMKTLFHAESSRGKANYGWLDTNYSFSFSNWYNPERMGFGKLRVLNDDIILPGYGFDTHPHKDMEIITIPLEGALEHKDSMDHSSVIRKGEVQVMTAGSGIYHSEFNHSKEEKCDLFQLWIIPREVGLKPRYDQKMYDINDRIDKIQTVVNPDNEGGLFIHQDAWLSLAAPQKGKTLEYQIKREGNGVYIMQIEGSSKIAGKDMSKRDAIGIWDTDKINIEATEDSDILIIDVPM